jgi:hypothetical protein
MTLSEALEAIGGLLQAFPNGGRQADKAYIGVLAATLMQYPRSLALECADPLRGAAQETRFLPTVADLVAWCQRRTYHMQSIVDREDWEAAIVAERQATAEAEQRLAEARKTRPTYDQLKAMYGPNWGLRTIR